MTTQLSRGGPRDGRRRRMELCLLLAGGLIGVPRSDAASPRPNIIFLVSEDNGPELGCYGDRYARTPNLDRLAAEGVRFNRAFVTQAVCSQSRSSLLTGLYPHQNGQIGLATWGFRLCREDTPNLVRSLKAVGYRTGIIGKLHVNPESAFPFDFVAIHSGNFARKDLAGYAQNAEQFIRESEAPFFLSVNYPDAHQPWTRQVDGLPAQPLDGKDVRPMAYMGVDEPTLRAVVADYYNCLSRLDTLVGDLLAALQRSGKAGNTLVIYLGDHGADMLRGKRTCHEGGVRIPLLVRWPGVTRPGQVREQLVSTVDLMPTALAAAGAAPVPNLPGRSLVPLLSDERADWRRYLFTEYHASTTRDFYPQRSVRDERFKLIENLLPGEVNPGYEITMDHFKANLRGAVAAASPGVRSAYDRMRQPPRWELYDLEADPFEFHDLSTDPNHAAVLTMLQRELSSWREQTADPLRKPENLTRLKAEFARFASLKAAEISWDCPYYFVGLEPPLTAAAKPAAKSGRNAKVK